VNGTVTSSPGGDGAVRVGTELGDIVAIAGSPGLKTGDPVAVVIRPERCELTSVEPDSPIRWLGVIEASLFLGAHSEHVVRIGSRTFLEWSVGAAPREPGTRVWLSVAPEHVRAVAKLDPTEP
jgi:iron(III) transport system ATP-binding protein